eukprot:CAMPEP_0183727150 /NCGR_PEP_ID=MMETSP0737-20130205/24981_1 /TAXON_ID=385413 /ORGANISM="Thalassiosira miniscula, Strain CCMP1093" /LENGTH=37 /DNA_ID= /DNA_START= /DNA_END= /DNA_ORIENTATION=
MAEAMAMQDFALGVGGEDNPSPSGVFIIHVGREETEF